MITDKDREILRYIEEVGMCTSKQIAKIFYRDKAQGEAIARRRFGHMIKANYLKVASLDEFTASNIYIYQYTDGRKIMKPSRHRLILLNYYAELLYNGAKVQYYKAEQYWLGGDIRSDGFFIYTFENDLYYDLVEVVTSHNKRNIDKYDRLYNSGEVHNITANIFPRVILIDDIEMKKGKIQSDITFIQLDLKLNKFPKIFKNPSAKL